MAGSCLPGRATPSTLLSSLRCVPSLPRRVQVSWDHSRVISAWGASPALPARARRRRWRSCFTAPMDMQQTARGTWCGPAARSVCTVQGTVVGQVVGLCLVAGGGRVADRRAHLAQ